MFAILFYFINNKCMNDLDLLDPLKYYNDSLKSKHEENVNKFFDELVKKSGINIDANKEACKKYYQQEKFVQSLKNKLNSSRSKRGFFIFLLIFSIILGIGGIGLGIYFCIQSMESTPIIIAFAIGVVHLVMFGFSIYWIKLVNKQISSINEQLKAATELMNKHLDEAYSTISALNTSYEENMAPKLFSKTLPLVQMDDYFDIKRYENLSLKYGLKPNTDEDSSVINVQSGTILGNPFLFERTYNMHMVNHTYTGELVIHWTTTSRDSKGNVYTHTHSQTLHASVTKPRPEYFVSQKLIYANEAAANLSFSRQPNELCSKDKKEIDKYVKKHEKDLTKLAEKALGKGGSYTPLGNAEFELLFGGLDRDNEVEYRLLFTPLAQKSMLNLLETNVPYGDDFSFRKNKCLNVVRTRHSQPFDMFVPTSYFFHFDYDVAKQNFLDYNMKYFQSVYFDFAPLFVIPLYQQHKAHEYIYEGTIKSNITPYEHECLANRFDKAQFADEKTKTDIILKTSFVNKKDDLDVIQVTAHSFDEIPELTLVPVLGGDGRWHDVPVHWYSYDALTKENIIASSYIGGNLHQYKNIDKDSSSDNMIYERGLLSYIMDDNHLNVDISSLKDKMSKN